MNLNFHAAWRTSDKFHTKRPSGGSARIAWDMLTQKGEIKSMRLLDGWWMCERPDGSMDEGIEAPVVLEIRSEQAFQRMQATK